MFNYIMQFKKKRIGLDISKWGKLTQVWCMLTEMPERDHTLAAKHIEGSTFIQVQHKNSTHGQHRNNNAPDYMQT